MAFASGNVASMKVDATEGGALTDISSYTQTVTVTEERDKKELPRLGGLAKAKIVGSVTNTIKLKGWYDPTLDWIFQSAQTATAPVTRSFEWGPQGTASNLPKITGEAYISSYEPETDSEDPGKWSAELEVDGAITYSSYA